MSTPHAERPRSGLVESLHIDHVPESERHGQARSLFFVWCGASLCMATVVIGAIVGTMGNSLFWSLLAMVVGNLAGAVFMALHSAQGPNLGVPQLIQSRGQFGFHGALLAVVLALVLYVGFFAFTLIPAAQSLNVLMPSISVPNGMWLVGVPSVIIAILGYRYIHGLLQITTYACLLAMLVLTIAMVSHSGLNLTPGPFSLGSFMLAASVTAVYQISFSPYVSDYSRYLPKATPFSGTFWNSYFGSALGAIWIMAIGLVLAALYTDPKTGQADVVAGVSQLLGGGPVSTAVLLTLTFGAIGINAMNLYGSQLSIITALSSLYSPRTGAGLRIAMILLTAATGFALAIGMSADFLANFQNFLMLLVYTFIPWTAINLTDYYLVRRGQYDLAGFFDRNGVYGRDPASWTYGGLNFKAMLAYVVGVLVQVPFINATYWKGWAVDALGGADVSYVFGLLVPALLFYALSTNNRTTRNDAKAADVVPARLAA